MENITKLKEGCFCMNEKVSFYEHLDPLLEFAQKFYGTNQAKGLLCQNAGLEPARWSEFVKRKKNFTAYYMNKFLESLNLDKKRYEEATGMAFTPEQIKELRIQQFVNANKEFIAEIIELESPDIVDILRKAIKNPETLQLLKKIFS